MERTRSASWPVLALYLLFTAATVGAFGVLHWRLEAASEHGKGVDAMILFLLVATGAMFIAGHGIAGWFIFRSSRPGAPGWTPVAPRSEWISTVIPVLIVAAVAEGGVLVIGLPVWGQVFGNDAGALQVEVVGKQFEWFARYPGKDMTFGRVDMKQVDDQLNPVGLDADDPAAQDDIVTRGTMAFPAGRTVSVRLRSLDVLHSFAIPLFRTKQDLVPGLPTRTQFRPTRAGRFEVACAELCGLGHYRMRAWATVLEPAAFETWLGEQDPFGE